MDLLFMHFEFLALGDLWWFGTASREGDVGGTTEEGLVGGEDVEDVRNGPNLMVAGYPSVTLV